MEAGTFCNGCLGGEGQLHERKSQGSKLQSEGSSREIKAVFGIVILLLLMRRTTHLSCDAPTHL